MTDAELRKLIKSEIKGQLNILLFGQSQNSTGQTEDIQDLFPGMPGIVDRPVMHPFGFVSRAVAGTIQVIGRIGEHFGNRMVLGHRDKDRPTSLAEGECALYSVGKYQVRVLKDKIQLGKDGVYETAVVGEKLVELLGMMLDEIIIHKHITSSPGAYTTPPDNFQKFTQQKANYVSNDKFLVKDGGRF